MVFPPFYPCGISFTHTIKKQANCRYAALKYEGKAFLAGVALGWLALTVFGAGPGGQWTASSFLKKSTAGRPTKTKF